MCEVDSFPPHPWNNKFLISLSGAKVESKQIFNISQSEASMLVNNIKSLGKNIASWLMIVLLDKDWKPNAKSVWLTAAHNLI